MFKLNLNQFLSDQTQLNERIFAVQKITHDQVWVKSKLCIMTELMELCNETRCFNYWSKKHRSTDEEVLEEFADVLCFLLSAILKNPFNEVEFDNDISAEDNEKLTLRFLELINLFAALDDKDYKTYQIFLAKLLELGRALGYSVDQIRDAYLKKLKKNYQVQESFLK